jgi:hypothetical protein
MKDDYGFAWAQAQYDRQEPPDDRFTDKGGYADEENEDDD